VLEIHQFRYSTDNLGYIIYSENEAIVVDGGNPNYVKSFLAKNNLNLLLITNTHSHFDHTTGNQSLKAITGVQIEPPEKLIDRKKIRVAGCIAEIIHTPGHTSDSLCIKCEKSLISGDTIFIANIGNCSEGNLKTFMESLDKLLRLPDETIVYPGHDYTERSIKRALSIEKSNKDIEIFFKTYSPPPIKSTIGTEKKINPYLRASEPEIVKHLQEQNKNTGSRFECFKSFMALY